MKKDEKKEQKVLKNSGKTQYGKNSQALRLKKQVRQAMVSIITGVILLTFSMASNFYMAMAQKEQLGATMSLNQYRLGSKALTYAIQSYAVTGNTKYHDQYMQELNEDKNRDKALEDLKKRKITDDEWATLNQITELSNGLVPSEEEALEAMASNNTPKAQRIVFSDTYEETVEEISNLTDEVIEHIQTRKQNQQDGLSRIQLILQILFIISFFYLVVQLIKTIGFANKELLAPIKKVSAQMEALAKGDFRKELDLEEDDSEVGAMVASISFMKHNILGMIEEISYILEQMGNGNYKVKVSREYVGEFVKIKDSFGKINEKMRETLQTIREATAQIDGGSEQLSCAAQDLAEGCTTQANQVSELVVVVDDLTQSMEKNSDAAKECVEIASNAGHTLMVGNEKMQELKEAIEEISKCSEEIESIIGAIEDIASQTNLLSLNAAIEAARAGEAGKGFAVVAEQVKSLAEESAQAAGRTTKLIEKTIGAVGKGSTVADETAVNISEVMEGAKLATDKMGQIAEMLENDVQNIQRLDQNIANVSSVVDNNSATSEETAAVSQEQTAQVQTMVSLVDKFVI